MGFPSKEFEGYLKNVGIITKESSFFIQSKLVSLLKRYILPKTRFEIPERLRKLDVNVTEMQRMRA